MWRIQWFQQCHSIPEGPAVPGHGFGHSWTSKDPKVLIDVQVLPTSNSTFGYLRSREESAALWCWPTQEIQWTLRSLKAFKGMESFIRYQRESAALTTSSEVGGIAFNQWCRLILAESEINTYIFGYMRKSLLTKVLIDTLGDLQACASGIVMMLRTQRNWILFSNEWRNQRNYKHY